jgi:hypothetical protein
MWFNLAAARLPPGKSRDLSVRGRDIVTKFMTPDQIAEAQRAGVAYGTCVKY